MSNITIKKNLIIFHKPREWLEIYASIQRDFGVKMSISFVIKRELGFTVRNHKGLVPFEKPGPNDLISTNRYSERHTHYYEDQVHLDFYSEAAQSWFQLKYLNRPDVVFTQQ